jgi:NAD-dependent dihydropyrimidine dehydrogenase PreA subunit
MKFQTVQQIAEWRLCVGCGACQWACPEGNVSLVDVEDDGIRPRIKLDSCKACGECVKVCPGVGIEHAGQCSAPSEIPELKKEWGRILEAWGFLQQYRPYRCYLCPDATGEFADISCGDPWYREKKEDEQGYSLMVVRTERGREIIKGAMESGYLTATRVSPDTLVESQRGMLAKRGAIWGRLLAMRMFAIPTPRYEGFYLYENWQALPAGEKARSVLGTIRRIVKRKYYRPEELPEGTISHARLLHSLEATESAEEKPAE